MDDSHLSAANPLRPVNWRRQLADRLISDGRFPSKAKCDRITRALAHYLQLSRQSVAVDLNRLPNGLHIRAAEEIYAGHRRDMRAAIEAAVLADQKREQIATTAGVSLECILWLEALHFDVRSRLNAPFFIIHDVIAAARNRGGANWKEFGWKLIAYLGGEEMLEQAMGINQIVSLEEFVAALDLQSRMVLQDKLCCAMQAMEIDSPATAARLLQAMRVGGKSSSDDQPMGPILKNIDEMMKGLGPRFTLGPDEKCQAIREFDLSAAELGDDQLMVLAMGGELPGLEFLKNLKYPDPIPNERA